MSLDESFLESPIAPVRQKKIVSNLWGSGDRYQGLSFRSFFRYYNEQCRSAFLSHGNALGIRTHQHIMEIASRIQRGDSRSEVEEFTRQQRWSRAPTSENGISASVDLSARILFMIDIGKFDEFDHTYTGRQKRLWDDGVIGDFVRKTFPQTDSPRNEGTKLDVGFTLCNIIRIAEFNVEPTSNLCDHLRLRDGTLEVFHQASFLVAQKQNSAFPDGFIDETLATLALLFPPGDKEAERWYKRRNDPERIDEMVLRCGKANRQTNDYNYWHDRLITLKQEFDEHRPSNFRQWWNDRRDVSQWYPLWVAICLSVLFGLIQSIEGALQVYKAYNP